MIKAIIFDMDGVLYNSMPMHLKIWEKIFSENNIPFNLKIYEEYNGNSSRKIAQKIVDKFGLDKKPEEILKQKIDMELIMRDKIADLFPETINILEKLKDNNFKIAIATGALHHTIDYVKKRFKIDKYSDVFIERKDVKNGKPFPDIFLLAAEKLKVKPEHCAVVEDAVNGIIAAKNAGMLSIAITTTSPKESFADVADHIIDNLDELYKLLGEEICVE